MSMASALMNHWIVRGSTHREYMSTGSIGGVKLLAWNHSVIKGNQFLPRERVASTGQQIIRAVPKNSSNKTKVTMLSLSKHATQSTKWWETEMKANMKNIKSQQDFDDQLLVAGDNLTVVHYFSPSCPAWEALHSKVHHFAGMNPELQFLLVNCNEHYEMARSHNVHVLPMFRFYRGAEGRIFSFSCTISTIDKFRAALTRFGVQTESLAAEKSLAEFEIKSFASPTDIPNKVDASQNTDENDGPIDPALNSTGIMPWIVV